MGATTAALFHFSFRYTHCASAPTVHNKYLHRFVKGLRFWGVSVAAAAATAAALGASKRCKQTPIHGSTPAYVIRYVCVCVCATRLRSGQVD